MKISKILEYHNAYKALEIYTENLGDGFLYKENSIYFKIRQKTLSLGFKFSSEYNNAFLVLPFAQLENIFKTKTISMVDNVSTLSVMSPLQLESIDWAELEMGYRKNYIFHESCHAVARSILSTSKLDYLTNVLLEESFANTCELFGMLEAGTPIHRIFYEANSYTVAFSDAKKIKALVDQWGAEKVFKFTMLSYLHSNFLYDSYSKSELKQVLECAFNQPIPNESLSSLGFISQVAFSLDEQFKLQTRQLHFKLNNIREAHFRDLRQTYLSQIIAMPKAGNVLDSLAKIFYT